MRAKKRINEMERMRGRIAGWGRGAGGRWRMAKNGSSNWSVPIGSSTPLVASFVLLVMFVIVFVGHSRVYLLHAGHEQVSAKYQAQFPGLTSTQADGELFRCDRSQFRTDICNMKGDIRMQTHKGNKSFVLYAKDPTTALGVEILKPYTRKWEKSCMDTVRDVTLRSVAANSETPAPPCDVHHSVPGVVFSNGGYTGNLYHEFNDGLLPLFITSQHLHREVVIVVAEFHNWWFTKYHEVVEQLSKYELVNLTNDTRVHCFPEIEAGLHIHDELAMIPDRMPNHETIRDFRATLDRAYTAKHGVAIPDEARMPRLCIIVRNGTRKFLNLDGIVKTAEELGFNVTLLCPNPTSVLQSIFQQLNSTDVLMGVHGAAMTHFLFMRPGTVFIQVVPLGTDWAASTYYGQPAEKMGLHYLPLKISPSESSLSAKYNATDPILTNPAAIAKQGWWIMKEIYLEGQDVRPSLDRVRALFKISLDRLKTGNGHVKSRIEN